MRHFVLLAAVLLSPSKLQAQTTVLYSEDFESGMGAWNTTITNLQSVGTLWHVESSTSTCGSLAAPFPSGTQAAWFGSPSDCTFDTGTWSWFDGILQQNAVVSLPQTSGVIQLSFRSYSQGEDDGVWDRRSLHVMLDGASWQIVPSLPTTPAPTSQGNVFSSTWRTVVYDLTSFAGHDIRLGFEFWAGDSWANYALGWLIDDVRLEVLDASAITFCAGDGIQRSCPCSSVGDPGRGCSNSFDPRGAWLQASGSASLSSDTLVLTASEISPAVVTFFAGPIQTAQAGGSTFGDGLRCVVGSVTRITAVPVNGVAHVPAASGLPLSARMLVTSPGERRSIQAIYRDSPSFCTTATYNLTNGLMVTWRP